MSQDPDLSSPLGCVVATKEEFDRFVTAVMPDLLERATAQTRYYLRETGQWAADVGHEKLALRWGYELVERFLALGPTEVPCRPFFLLDSLIAKYYSQPRPVFYHKDLLSPLGRFLEALTARAVVSRDALMALFYHVYGFGQPQVASVFGLDNTESQRIYKNFERWRQSGWQRTMEQSGTTERDLAEIEEEKRRHPEHLNEETDRMIRLLQAHYRKSEPQYYPCLARQKWSDLAEQNYGYEYRVWHLALCRDCFTEVWDLRCISHVNGSGEAVKPRVDLHLRPFEKTDNADFCLIQRGGPKGMERDEVQDYRERLVRALLEYGKHRCEEVPGLLQVFVNEEGIGTLNFANVAPVLVFSSRERPIQTLEIRTESGGLLGRVSAPAVGVKTAQFRVLTYNVDVTVHNQGPGGSVTVTYQAPARVWQRVHHATASFVRGWAGGRGWDMAWGRAIVMAQVLLAGAVLFLLTDRLTYRPIFNPQPESEGSALTKLEMTHESLQRLEERFVQLAQTQTATMEVIQAQHEQISHMHQTVQQMSGMQRQIRGNVVAM